MENIKTQYGDANTCDFGDRTWTFSMMTGDFEVQAGVYAIVDHDLYRQMIKVIEDSNEGQNNDLLNKLNGNES